LLPRDEHIYPNIQTFVGVFRRSEQDGKCMEKFVLMRLCIAKKL
jgi:hypothetical protein